jgi:tetratricopeptide (TPR) repeat protein
MFCRQSRLYDIGPEAGERNGMTGQVDASNDSLIAEELGGGTLGVGDNGPAIDVFISYARSDRAACTEFVGHLALLRRQGLVRTWHDAMIRPGEDWDAAIRERLHAAKLVILLISKNFLASDFCYGVELQYAMDRHDRREALVVPILLSPCDVTGASFMRLQVLPSDARPVTQWSSQDDAWTDVTAQLRSIVVDLKASLERAAGAKSRGATRSIPPEHVVQPVSQMSLLARYVSWKSWISDFHDLLGAVIGAGGLRRTVRTFGRLTTDLGGFLSYISMAPDTADVRSRYLSPAATTVTMTTGMLCALTAVTLLADKGKTLGPRDIPKLFSLTAILGVVAASMIRLLSTRIRSWGESLAVVFYAWGFFFIPFLIYATYCCSLVAVTQVFIGIYGSPLFMALVVTPYALLLVIAPWVIAYWLSGMLTANRWKAMIAVPLFAYASFAISLVVLSPGDSAIVGAAACLGANKPECADTLSGWAVKLQPEKESLWITRVNMLRNSQRDDEALRAAESGLRVHTSSAWLHYDVAELTYGKDPNRCLEEFRTALAINPTFEEAAIELSYTYIKETHYEEALKLCAEVTAFDSWSAKAKQACHRNAGIAALHLGKIGEARSHLTSALTYPDVNDTYLVCEAYLAGLQSLEAQTLPGRIFISAVAQDSPAKRIGLKPSTLLVRIGDKQPRSVEDWVSAILTRPEGDVELTVIDAGGERRIILPSDSKKLGISLDKLR